jgi:AcrR family transcriptional regulator
MPSKVVKIQNLECALNTAYKLYLKFGIDKVTKEMIARECGLSRKSIDRYFPDKTDCVLQVLEWIMSGIQQKAREIFPESVFFDGHTGIELLEMYMKYVKRIFLHDPKLFVLYTEFKLYIYRNCKENEQEYSLLVNKIGNHALRTRIYDLGKQDGTFPADLDVKTEEEYFTESFFGFLANLALSLSDHARAELEKQIDYRIANTVALYSSEGKLFNQTLGHSTED